MHPRIYSYLGLRPKTADLKEFYKNYMLYFRGPTPPKKMCIEAVQKIVVIHYEYFFEVILFIISVEEFTL